MNNIIKSCGLAAAVVSLSACATVTRGTSQKFEIMTMPTAADVKLSTGQTCTSPCKLKLKRRPGFTATVSKGGYQTQDVIVESKVKGGGVVAGAGNLILGGVIGGIVDGTNGSLYSLTPDPLNVTLVPLSGNPVSAIEPVSIGEPTAVAQTDAVPAPVAVAADPAVAAAPAPGGE
ncbi:MAG: hypothetical protein ABI617_04125 [Sphingomicrobium sp.]